MNRRVVVLCGIALVALLAALGSGALYQPPPAPTENPPESAAAQQLTAVPARVEKTQPPAADTAIPVVEINQPTQPAASDTAHSVPASPVPASPVPQQPVPAGSILQLPAPAQPVTNQMVITFNPGTPPEQQQAYLESIGATIVQNVGALNTVVANVPPAVAAQPLPASPAVAASEPDYFVVALEAPVNDALYEQQWALPVIGAPEGWTQLSQNTPTIAVAVVDSGICADHPDLIGRVLPGYDFIDDDNMPQDTFGHGCNVAGVIAANGNNGLGIAGVAPNARILPVRVLNAQGIGTYSDVAAGIVYAADHGAQIINLSLGGVNSSSVLQSAVDYAVSKGTLVIAAAGNNGGAVLYPAAYAPVIAVASVDANLQRSSFSSYGPEVDLLAPGRDILTTSADGSYRTVSGTSFAAPQVAGVAALEIALGRTLTTGGGIVRVGGGQHIVPTSTAVENAIPTIPPQPTQEELDISAETITRLYDRLEQRLLENRVISGTDTHLLRLNHSNFYPYVVLGYFINNDTYSSTDFAPYVAIAYFDGQIWEVRIREIDGAGFNDWLYSIPDNVLSPDTKILFAYSPPDNKAAAQSYSGHYLPWENGVSHTVTKWPYTGPSYPRHSNNKEVGAWDFALSIGTELWASKEGTIKWLQDTNAASAFSYVGDNTWCTPVNSPTNYVVLNHDDGSATLYLHLKQNGVPDSYTIGQTRLKQGDTVGYSGNTGYVCTSSPAGTPPASTRGAHLHFQVGAQSETTWYTQSGDVTFSDTNWNASQANPVSGNSRSSTATPPPDTGSGQMKLHSQSNLGGTVLFSSNGGFSNDPAANSYSMTIPNGWSVKTWRADNGPSSGSEMRCWTGSVMNLQDHGWQNSIQSVEVFTSNVCDPPVSSDVRLCRTDDGNNCTVFPIGADNNLTDNDGLSDQVRSVRVPSGKSLFVFNDENFRNSADCYTGDRIPLPVGSPWDMRGQVTSIVILNEGGCPWSKVNSVVLFETNDFGGPKLGIGSYPHWENIPQLNSYFNDKAVSIHIPAGLSVYLWEHDNRTEPRTACLTGDVANLGSMAGKASSIEVFGNTSCQPAVPVTPSNFRATSTTETSITLGWNDVANEDGYKIYKWSVVNDVWDFYYLTSVGANTTSYTDNALNCGGLYHYQVSAYNAGGESWRAGFISVTTNNCTAPPVPSNLRATGITADSITLGWNDGTNETGYNIYKWNVVNNVWEFYYLASVGANVTSYTDTGLTCEGVYHYRISAYNNSGESGYTGFISVTTNNCTAPPVPTNLRATTITSSSITLGWNDGVNETGYKVYKWGEVNGVWEFYYLASVGANVTSYTDNELTCAGVYHYQISAYNNTGESERTGSIQVIAAACTDTTPPGGVMTAPGRQSYQAGPVVTLRANAWDDTSGVNRVEFYWWNGSNWESLGTDSTAPYTFDWNIGAISERFLWASANIYDNAGNSSGILGGDEYWTYFTIDRTAPVSAVNTLPANQTGLSFIVTWSGTDAASGSDYLLYDVQVQENCTGDWYDWVVMGSVTGATFYGDWNTQYCFRSRAYDVAGNVEAWPAVADASTRAQVDSNPPTANFIVPQPYTAFNTSLITAQIDASDMESGVSAVEFIVGYNDGTGSAASLEIYPTPPSSRMAGDQEIEAQGWDWHWRGWDTDGSDGWSITWDASDVPDQTASINFFAYVYDHAGNWSATWVDNHTLDRAAPYGSMTMPLRDSYHKGPEIMLRADVADATSGVNRVRFYVWSAQPWSNQEWIYLGEDTTYPFEYNWSIGSITDGQVYLTAEVTDFAGNSIWLWGDDEWSWIAVDRTPPVSSVNSLPANQETNEFVVTWNGWDNFTDGNYLRYDVQVQVNCTGTWLNWRSQIEGVQAGLFTGTYGYSYCFRSRAYDAVGNVEAWPPVHDTQTRVRDPLSAPTTLSPANNAHVGRFDSITLNWNAVSYATDYYVEFWDQTGVTLTSGWMTDTSWTLPAQSGGQYQWHVKARDAVMESDWSATRNLAVRYGPAGDLSATVYNNYQVGLAWSPSVDAPDNISGYTIDFIHNGTVSRRYTASASAMIYIASGLECERTYTIVVRAYKGSLESDNSNAVTVTLEECDLLPPTPYSPANQASTTTQQPWFWWMSAAHATGYEIQIGTTSPPETPPVFGTGNFYVPPNPLLTTTYYWRVRSVRNSRVSEWSTIYSFTITSPANAAPGRNLITTATPTLSWGAVTWATGYQIEWSNTTAFSSQDTYFQQRWASADQLSVETNQLPDGTYYWRVRAQRADGTWSGWSAVETFTIDAP